MDTTQMLVVTATALSGLATSVIVYLKVKLDYWQSAAEQCQKESLETAREQGKEAETWRERYYEQQKLHQERAS